ncbi:MAG: polyphosphate kinase 2 family protein [Planctomycetaceae bacterium]|nr:polyphosphate kinase 2 family protein [Planctomycetaceae bacterium]
MAKAKSVLQAMRVGKNDGKLAKRQTDATDGVEDKKDARARLAELTDELSSLQYNLYAEAKTAVLVVFQAMDTGGKDGVIRKVFGPLNPQGVRVTSFKQPSQVELAHDYLWRIHKVVPPKGMIGIFNRSHYEDVLIRRVHHMDPEKIINQRYEQINEFEKYLSQNNVAIVKFFLHISKDEQKARLQARLDKPDKRWKFEKGDLSERAFWDDYQTAYGMMLSKCSTGYAPWYAIPADRKWYRDWAVASVLVDTLRRIGPRIPEPKEDLSNLTVE